MLNNNLANLTGCELIGSFDYDCILLDLMLPGGDGMKIRGKGEIFLNATDLFNTMIVKGDGFSYTSTDYYETQVIRAGYGYKF